MENDKKREIVTREEAINAGKVHYFTGEKCRNGHVEERNTITAQCKACVREAQQRVRDGIRRRLEAARAKASAS